MKNSWGISLQIVMLGSALPTFAACGRIAQGGPDENASHGVPPSPTSSATPSPAPTSSSTPTSVSCAWDGPFVTITPIAGISQANVSSGSVNDIVPRLTPDELTLTFSRTLFDSDGDLQSSTIYLARRADRTAAFGEATSQPLGVEPWGSSMSSDGLRLFFVGCDSEVSGICVSSRKNTSENFSSGTMLSLVTPFQTGGYPFVSADDATLWFVSETQDQQKEGIYAAQKSGTDFANPIEVTELNVAQVTSLPTVSADNLTIYTSQSGYTPNTYDANIFISHRATSEAPFSAPVALSQINTPFAEEPGWISPDSCRLYFSQTKTASPQAALYVAERAPQK